MVKSVIFDLDGVLLDSMPEIHRLCLNQALWEVEKFEITKQIHSYHFNGLPTKQKLLKLLESGVIQYKNISKIEELKQKFTIQAINDNIKFDREKYTLLTKLKENGFLLGVCTNSIKQTATLMLQKIGVYELLDILITNEDVKNNKPSPDCYIEAFHRLNLYPKQCLIIEDSQVGIESANASGGLVLWVKDSESVTYDNIMKFISTLKEVNND